MCIRDSYSIISKEVKEYVKGAYGKTPGPVSEDLKKMVLTDGQQEITVRPGSLLAPEWDQMKQEAGSLARCEEDIMTYALFPAVAKEFLKKKYSQGDRT